MKKGFTYYLRKLGVVVASLAMTLSTIFSSTFCVNTTENITAKATEPQPMVGIDVSEWNAEIDWKKVRDAGVEFAIIRICGHNKNTNTYRIDPYFERNVREAQAQGIHLGAYFFSYAPTLLDVTNEANMVVDILKDYPGVFSFPIVFDAETGDTEDDPNVPGKDVYDITNFAGEASQVFCEILKENGYYPMVYSFTWWFNNVIDASKVSEYDLWHASYPQANGKEKYAGTGTATGKTIPASERATIKNDDNVTMWQYTGAGNVDGIYVGDGGNANVDMNISYVDYTQIIPTGGYNGYPKGSHVHNYKPSYNGVHHYDMCECGNPRAGSVYEHSFNNCKCACGFEKHAYQYQNDGASHWQYCVDCQTQTTPTAHDYQPSYNGAHHYKICVCGNPEAGTVFEHSYQWIDDSGTHYKQCNCGYIDESTRGEHLVENGACTVCPYEENEGSSSMDTSDNDGGVDSIPPLQSEESSSIDTDSTDSTDSSAVIPNSGCSSAIGVEATMAGLVAFGALVFVQKRR